MNVPIEKDLRKIVATKCDITRSESSCVLSFYTVELCKATVSIKHIFINWKEFIVFIQELLEWNLRGKNTSDFVTIIKRYTENKKSV